MEGVLVRSRAWKQTDRKYQTVRRPSNMGASSSESASCSNLTMWLM